MRCVWMQILALPLTSDVTLVKCLISVLRPHSQHWYKGGKNNINLRGDVGTDVSMSAMMS